VSGSDGSPERSAVAPVSGVHHIAITVSDLDRSVAWYSKVFGLVETMRAGGSGPQVSAVTQVPDARVTAVFLTVGDVHVELLHHETEGQPFDRRNNDIGTMHVCFLVPDVDQAYEALRHEDVAINAPPVHNTEGPLRGWSALYLRDPDGIQLELLSQHQ